MSVGPQKLQNEFVVACSELPQGLLKKGTEWPTTILKADLVPAFTKRQAAHHLVRRGKDQLVGKGAPTPLEVYTDKRQGSKRITRVVGLEGYLLSPDKVAGDLQRAFNGSASVQDVPGKQKLHEVGECTCRVFRPCRLKCAGFGSDCMVTLKT